MVPEHSHSIEYRQKRDNDRETEKCSNQTTITKQTQKKVNL